MFLLNEFGGPFGAQSFTDAIFSQQYQLAVTQPNPVASQVRDPQELKYIFDYLGIVPPFMDGDFYAFNYMRFFLKLGENCESHSAAIRGIAAAAFSDSAFVGVSNFNGFGEQVREATAPETTAFASWLNGMGVSASHIVDLNKLIWRALCESGNAYVRCRISTVAGQQQCRFEMLPYWLCAYSKDIIIGKDYGLYYSPIWSLSYWVQTEMPTLYAVTRGDVPNFRELEDGTLETVFHFTEANQKTAWYGVPSTMAAMSWMHYEVSQSDALVRQAANRWAGSMLFLMEAAPDAVTANTPKMEQVKQAQDIQNRISNSLTMQGQNRSGVGVIRYPNGAQRPEAVRLMPMTDHEYIKATATIAREKIYGAHGFTPVLSGELQANTGLGGNVMGTAIAWADVFTIKPAQNKMQRHWQAIFGALAEATAMPQMSDRTLFFRSPLERLLEQLPQNANTDPIVSI